MRPGDSVGQYTLVRYIGKGGMAEVWEARHLYLNKGRLAIKFLLPQFATNSELQERFLKEAQRQLDHPNIIAATDFFQIDGCSYMVMQYVPPPVPNNEPESLEEKPKSLEDRLEEHRPMAVEEIRSISADLLSALDFAHSHGVVHRDVKPANVLLHRDGRALLTDFGIAKGLREERSMTRIGTSLGTPDYMSPEQIRRPTQVDARSDIYSFGCVLYAMLSRNPPFGSEETTEYEIKDSHVRVTPPPIVYWNRNIPIAVEAVVFKCLEKEPEKRYQSCGAVMLALNAALEQQPIANPVPPPAPAQVRPEPPTPQPRVITHPEPAPTPQPAPRPNPPVLASDSKTVPLPAHGVYSHTRVDMPPAMPPAAKPTSPVPPPTPPPSKSVVPPPPPLMPSKSGIGKYLIIAAVALVLLGAGFFVWQSSRHSTEPASTNYATLAWDDPQLANCGDNASCLARKSLADRLANTHWQQVRFDSQLLSDCMNYPQCLETRDRAAALAAVANWSGASQKLLDDCMGYPRCETELQRRKQSATPPAPTVASNPAPVVKPSRVVDPENLPSCCKDSPNPAQCRAQKKANGIRGDCVLGH